MMKLQIEQPYADAMLEAFPALMPLRDQLRFGSRVEVACNQLSGNELAFLHELYAQAGQPMYGRAAQIATLRRVMNDAGKPIARVITRLDCTPPGSAASVERCVRKTVHDLRVHAEASIPKPVMKRYKTLLRECLFG
jgi:hypothetical protein